MPPPHTGPSGFQQCPLRPRGVRGLRWGCAGHLAAPLVEGGGLVSRAFPREQQPGGRNVTGSCKQGDSPPSYA